MNWRLNRRESIRNGLLATLALSSHGPFARKIHADEISGARDQWWTWRGPTGNNISASQTFSIDQFSKNNILWASPVPSRGHSSPIVSDRHIYLATADKAAGTQSVLAYDRRSGKQVWNQLIHQGGIPAENHPNNTEASPTVAYDGERIIASFYNSSAIWLSAVSTDGKPLWQQSVGRYEPNAFKYGYAASPALYRDTVIVAADYDGQSFLAAHDRKTGKPVWKVPRKNATSFSSPIIAMIAGRDQLLISGGESIISYDPANGEVLWSAEALAMATCGTLVWDGDLVFGSGGYPKSETACVRADGSGEVVWSNSQKCYEQSMLAVDGYLYAVTDAGVAICYRGNDGEVMWRERLGGSYSSSPVLAGDRIYVLNEQGEGFIFKANPEEFKSVGGGKLAEECFATPSIVDDTMYLRLAKNNPGPRQEYLVAMK